MSEYSKLFRTDNRTVKLRQGISILQKKMMLKPIRATNYFMNNPFFALLSQLKPFTILRSSGFINTNFEAELYGDAFFTPLLGPTAEKRV